MHIGRGGQSVKEWRGVNRQGVASTSRQSFCAPRNVVADTIRRDGALVIHRQVRPADPFGSAYRFYFGVVEGHIRFLNNQLGKEVDADYEKRDDEPLRALFQSPFHTLQTQGPCFGTIVLEFT